MSPYELANADRWRCYRYTYEEELVNVYPRKSAVTRVENPYIDAWNCHGLVDFEWNKFRGEVAGEPIPDADRMGLGLIGADLDEEDDKFFVTGTVSDGAADRAGVLSKGDHILAVSKLAGGNSTPAEGLTLRQLIWHIRGEPGTAVDLILLPAGSYETRKVTITREAFNERLIAEQKAKFQAKERQEAENAVASLVINGNSGQYMSPYTSDCVTAEWVNKAINANIGATAGSGVGAAAGAYAANKALESVPFASVFGGMIGSAAGESIGRETAIEASGGWEHIRATSDISFTSLENMTRYLRLKHGNDENFKEAFKATLMVYPELSGTQ